MSFAFEEEVAYPTPFRHLVDWSWVWVGLLVLAKALDAGTTAVGLLFVPGFVEGNPIAAFYFDALGVVTGLLTLSVLTVVIVASVTEFGARYLEGHEESPDWGPTATRVVGYVPLSVVFIFAALHNTGLIVRVVLLG